jgi:hypothetical protein
VVAADGNRPDIVVDVSNACRDRRLGDGDATATLDRLWRLFQTWVDQFGFVPEWVGIADANLRFVLDPRDRAAFASLVREARIEECHGDADKRVLELAGDLGAAVLSNDAFKGHRRRHPWIQGNTRDFVGWRLVGDAVGLVIRDMGVRSDSTISAAQEEDLIKERRLRGHADVLESAYRCDSPTCLYHQYSPDRLPSLPAVAEDGSIVCPGCNCELTPIGERPAAAELKLSAIGGPGKYRWLLEEGRAAIFGRGSDADGDVSRILERKLHPLISRRHVQIAVIEGRLIATDLGSTNGTTVQRREHARPGDIVDEPLMPGRPTEIGVRDRIVLAGVIAVDRSGQRFPAGRPSVTARLRGSSGAGATHAR